MSEESTVEPEVLDRVTDYQRELTVFALRSLSEALYAAALVMTVVYFLIWVSTGDAPGRLLGGIAGVVASAVLLWSSATNVPRPKSP